MTTDTVDYNLLEKKQAKLDGAKLVKNSGRGMKKGDAIWHELLLDYKFTEGKSFSLNNKAFQKHLADARLDGDRIGTYVIIFQEEPFDKKYAIVDWEWLKSLYEDDAYLSEEVYELKQEIAGLNDTIDQLDDYKYMYEDLCK